MKAKAHVFSDNMDFIEDPPVRIITAEISMISEKDGGRYGPFTKGYRPNHNFSGADNSSFYIGEIEVEEDQWIHTGETKILDVKFMNVQGLDELLTEGNEWRIQEGHKLVGTGKILNIKN